MGKKAERWGLRYGGYQKKKGGHRKKIGGGKDSSKKLFLVNSSANHPSAEETVGTMPIGSTLSRKKKLQKPNAQNMQTGQRYKKRGTDPF